MSWIGGRLTSITGQISNLTKDILTEGTEEVSDHVTELRLSHDRLRELDALCIQQKEENDRLKHLVREWEVKAESSELQINSISREYRAVLDERDAEIKQLKQQHHEHQELKVSYLAGETGHPAVLDLNNDGFESVGYQGGDEHDFGENIAMQHEINRLRGDVHRTQAQCEHWKKLVQQNTSNSANGETDGTVDKGDNPELLKQIQDLQHELGHEKEVRQHELASLQDAHSHKISTLRKCHKDEVAELTQKIAELDWGSEGWQTQAPDESFSLKQTITSLQEEIARLRLEHEDHLQQIAGLNLMIAEQTPQLVELKDTVEQQTSELAISQAQTMHLENQMKVSKAEIDRLLADHEQVGHDLYDAKQQLLDQMDANHADALEVLSDLREVRQQMDTGTIDRRNKLLEDKDKIINQMIVSGHKKRELTDSVALFAGEEKRLKEETKQMVSELGDRHRQELTADIIDSIEKENLLLRKRNVALQEQVTLLERAVQNITKEKTAADERRLAETQSVSADSGNLAGPDSDTFSDTMSFTSDLSELSRRNMELDEQVDSLRCQIGKYESEIEKFELMRVDWLSEKTSLEDVLLQLRGQLKDKENSLNVVEAQKGLAEAVMKGGKLKKAWKQPSLTEEFSDGLIAVEKQEHSSPASGSSSDNESIMEDVIKLDSQVGLLTEANAQLEYERDLLVEEKESLQRDLAELRVESSASTSAMPPNGDADDLNTLLQEKEDELQLLMEEAEDMKRDLAEVPNLKLQLQQTQHEVENLQKCHSESVSSNTTQELQILKNSFSAMEQELMRLKQEKADIDSLGHEVDCLKQKIRNKNEEIVNLSLEKEDLMSSLQELDNQHEEAMSRVIVIKNELAKSNEDLKVKLMSSETEIQELRSEIQLVKQQQLVNQSIESSDSNELNHQIAELKEDNQDLTQRINNYCKTVSDLETNIEEEKKSLTEMNEKLLSSATALNNLHMDKQESAEELDRLKEEIRSKIAKIKEQNKENIALHQENNGLKQEIKLFQTENESQQLLKESATNCSKNEVRELLPNIESLKFELDSKDKQCIELQNNVQSLVEENENNKVCLLKADNDYMSLRNEKAALESEVDELKNSVSEKEAKCSQLGKDLEAAQKDCKILSAQSERKCAECESFSTQLRRHEGELHRLKTELGDRDQEITSLSAQLDAVKEEASLKESKCASVESELESVKELLKDATDKLHTKCEDCNELTEQLEILQNELTSLRNKADSQTAELNSLNSQVLSATGELVLVKEELRNKNDECDAFATETTNLNDALSAAITDQSLLQTDNKQFVLDCETLNKNCEKLNERLKECTDDFRAQIKKLENENDQLISEKEILKNDLGAMDNKLAVQTGHYESYINELKSNRAVDANTLQSQHSALTEESHQKDLHISELASQVSVFEGKLKDNIESIQSLTEANNSLSELLNEKDRELKSLQSLHSQCSQQILLNSALVETLNNDKEKLLNEIQGLNDENNNSGLRMKEMENLLSNSVPNNVHSELIKEKEILSDRVKGLLSDVNQCKEIIKDHETGIADLNQRYSKLTLYVQNGEETLKSQEGIIEVLRQSSVQKDTDISILQRKLTRAKSFVDEIHHDKIDSAYDAASPNYHLPALEYKESEQTIEEVEVCETVKHLESEVNQQLEPEVNGQEVIVSQKLASDNAVVPSDRMDVDGIHHEIEVSKEIDTLRNQLGEKDSIIAELQRNNSSLLKMFQTKSKSSRGDAALLEVHKLENEVRVLRLEREQIMDVMNEKSRECSNLKTEVHQLMNAVSAENEALSKLQTENQELIKQSPEKNTHGEHIDEMQKEVVKNLSRLIRDKDLEVEALTQKNQTLLQVMQESSQDGSQINSLMQDKDNLSKQVTALQAERETMIVYLNQKHQESLAYHNEVQRLTTLVNTEAEQNKLIKQEYESIVPKFEDKQQALVKSENELLNYKQKFTELEVKYGQLLQQSNVEETVDRVTFESKADEAQRLQERYKEVLDSVKEKEQKIQNLHQNVNELESNLRTVNSERGSYKKQVDNFVFQLHGLQTEQGDFKSEISQLKQNKTALMSEYQSLKEMNNKVTLQLQDRDFEIRSMQEKMATLTMLMHEKQGEKGQLDNLVKENEATQKHIQHMQQERDHAVMALQQKQKENDQLLRDIHVLNDKEGRLRRELERLREHLIQIEDGYTKEALASEEREKDLRNRLSVAEEQTLSSFSKVENASQLSSQQIDSLQQQLHFVSSQRDQAYLQLSTLQEQNQMYSVSMANLQMVLEQFQQEKENLVAQETERYEKEVRSLSNLVEKLQIDLAYTKGQLDEVSDGLEAAARLSEQLDRKEEAIDTLREEVHIRDSALKAAEAKLHKLTSRSDDKVDKLVIKNLLLGYFTAVQSRRHDVLRAIGGVLLFSPDDYEKIEGPGKGWVPGFLKFGGSGGGGRSPGSPLSTPVRRSTVAGPTAARPNNSFSEMFVRFLERESSPPPPAVRLPAEEMVRDVQKQKEAHKPAYNPFTAPRHVALPIQTSQNVAGSPLLMGQQSPVISHSMPTFAAPSESSKTPPGSGRSTPASSSTILKDVLNTR